VRARLAFCSLSFPDALGYFRVTVYLLNRDQSGKRRFLETGASENCASPPARGLEYFSQQINPSSAPMSSDAEVVTLTLLPTQIQDLKLASSSMTGATRRAFQAQMTLK
jgi:hypothetical protein